MATPISPIRREYCTNGPMSPTDCVGAHCVHRMGMLVRASRGEHATGCYHSYIVRQSSEEVGGRATSRLPLACTTQIP